MPDLGDLNWLSIVIAVVAAQVLGFLWYGPLFGKQWMAAIGKTKEDMSGSPGPAVAVGIVMSLVRAVILALLIGLSATPDLASGLKVGLLLAAVTSSGIITGHAFEERISQLTWINCAYEVVMWAIMGAIIGGMW
jgi:hypothetical protein